MTKSFKIILATDYSEAVMNAERYAVQFAKSTNSDLRLVHVYEIPLSYSPAKPIEFSKSCEDFHNSEIAILEQHRDKLFHSLDIKKDELNSNCVVREGSAGKQIREEAEDWEADFIIVGTHGVSGFRKLFFGTHTWDVIKKSSVPVLAIPIDGMFNGIKNIVFALEQREGEILAINYLVKLAKQFDADVTALHLTSFVLPKEFEIEMFEKFRADIHDKILYDKLSIRLEYNHDIIQGLNDCCLRAKADWLVMSPQKPSLFEKIIMLDYSVTKNMSFYTRTPLLAIPEYYNTDNLKFWEMFELDEKYMNQGSV